jgi:hypothetical protein
VAKASARLGGAATLSECLGRRLRSSLRPAAAGRGAAGARGAALEKLAGGGLCREGWETRRCNMRTSKEQTVASCWPS